MILTRFLLSVIVIFSFSCKGQISTKDSAEINNAKWYYYGYAMDLKAYDKDNVEVPPLICDVKTRIIKHIDPDNTKIYFACYDKDTLNECSFKPLALIGITVVGNRLYIPIYHAIIFDYQDDNTVLADMNKHDSLLKTQISKNQNVVTPWLKEEAKKRSNHNN